MSIFPVIEHIDQLREKVSHHPEVRFTLHPNGFTTACYMIGNSELWSGEDAAWVAECRGITFDREGKIAMRPLHKFFNVGERPHTQRGVINWGQVVRLMDKRDGSMINPVLVDGKVQVKSKKSFTSDVANLAQAYIDSHSGHYNLSFALQMNAFTPTFEYTSPKARIVLNYGEEDLVLLHIRCNITGEYLSDSEVRGFANLYDVPVVDTYSLDSGVHTYLDNLDTLENMEGYIFQFQNGDMVKAKCKWYLDLHHNVTFLSERRVAEMVLDEIVDDFKSYLADTDSTDSLVRVEEIETKVSFWIASIEAEVEMMANQYRDWPRKDFAIKHCKHPMFGMAVKLLDGREPDYKEYYRKNMLKAQFGLDQV